MLVALHWTEVWFDNIFLLLEATDLSPLITWASVCPYRCCLTQFSSTMGSTSLPQSLPVRGPVSRP